MFGKLATAIERGLIGVLLVVLTVMVTAIVIQIVGRYVFSTTPSWTEEIARMCMAWVTMLGSAALVRRDDHIAVTAMIDACPPALARALLALRDALILVMAGGLTYYGYGLALIGGRRTSPALDIPMFYPYLAIPVGAALIAVMLVLHRLGTAHRDIGSERAP